MKGAIWRERQWWWCSWQINPMKNQGLLKRQ